MSKQDELRRGLDPVITKSINRKQGSKAHPTVSAQEAAERQATGKTQGAKGAKLPRINLAFTPDNYEFIKKYARCRGTNYTDFINHIIEDYRKEHQKEFDVILDFIEKT